MRTSRGPSWCRKRFLPRPAIFRQSGAVLPLSWATSDSNAAAPMAAGPGTGTGIAAGPHQREHRRRTATATTQANSTQGAHLRRRAEWQSDQSSKAGLSADCPAGPCIGNSRGPGNDRREWQCDLRGSRVWPSTTSSCGGQAARGARFSPTKLSGQPVKVTGVITYNFVAQ